MLKHYTSYFLLFTFSQTLKAQTLYSENFNNLAALNSQTFSTVNGIIQYGYSDFQNGIIAINNGNKKADTLGVNYPFKSAGQKDKGWLVYKPHQTQDTFAVSTSWLSPTSSADNWLITPNITNISTNSVLSWEAMAPDIQHPDGYEVYISTYNSSVPLISEFTSANRLFSTEAESSTWTKRGISLANYAGQSIRIAFRHNSNNKFQLWIDDIIVENISNTYDISAASNDVYPYSTINTAIAIKSSFQNKGYIAASTLVVNYKVGNNATISESKILASTLNYLQPIQLNFNTPFISSTPGLYEIKVWVSSINNQADQNNLNDTVYIPLTLMNSIPEKKILVESFASAKDGWTPDAQHHHNITASTNSFVVAAIHHGNDSLSHSYTSNLKSDYNCQYSEATVDQMRFGGQNSVGIRSINTNTFITQRKNMIVPATVTVTNISYNNTTGEINATVESIFYGDVKSDFRLNLYIKENNVYGPINENTDNGWNQYNFSYATPTSPFFQLGSYLNENTYLLAPNQYAHNHVIHDMLDGAYGTPGIIPSTGLTAGQTYTKTYTYTLPNTLTNAHVYNADNIYLIGVLSQYDSNPNQRSIINVSEVKLTTNAEQPVGITELARENKLLIYPNPASNFCYVSLNSPVNESSMLSVFNTLGEIVYSEQLEIQAGQNTLLKEFNLLNSGTYFIKLDSKNIHYSTKLTIIK
jgi:hypothetical protein